MKEWRKKHNLLLNTKKNSDFFLGNWNNISKVNGMHAAYMHGAEEIMSKFNVAVEIQFQSKSSFFFSSRIKKIYHSNWNVCDCIKNKKKVVILNDRKTVSNRFTNKDYLRIDITKSILELGFEIQLNWLTYACFQK